MEKFFRIKLQIQLVQIFESNRVILKFSFIPQILFFDISKKITK